MGFERKHIIIVLISLLFIWSGGFLFSAAKFSENLILMFYGSVVIIFPVYFYTRDIVLTGVSLMLATSLLFSSEFHNSLSIIIATNFPLLMILIFAVFSYLLNGGKLNLKLNYVQKPVLIFFLYNLIIYIAGLSNGTSYNSSIEIINISMYGAILLLPGFIKDDESYYKLIKIAMFILLLIAIQYTVINLFISSRRFVTFQADLLPFGIGIASAYFVYSKKNKLFGGVIAFLITFGLVITLTRGLWVAALATISLVGMFWLYEKGYSVKKMIVIVSLVILAGIGYVVKNTGSQNLNQGNTVEDRAKGFTNPTEDHSLLMRVELGFYIVQKIIAKPFTGHGFGDFVQYKFLGKRKGRIIYPDNSYLYLIWKIGLIGFLIYVWMIYRIFKQGINILRFTENSLHKIIILGTLAGFCGILVYSLTTPSLIAYNKLNLLYVILFTGVELFNKHTLLKTQ